MESKLKYLGFENEFLKITRHLGMRGTTSLYEAECKKCKKTFSLARSEIKISRSCGCGRIKAGREIITNAARYEYASKAKVLGCQFALSKFDVESLISSVCFYCGAEPASAVYRKKRGGKGDLAGYRNDIDRVDSSIGYVVGNCVSSCFRCNFAKSDMSVAEFSAWVEKVHAHLHKPV